MPTGHYHRDQADLCLEMAGHTATARRPTLLRGRARHFAQAIELEKHAQAVGDPRETPSHDGR